MFFFPINIYFKDVNQCVNNGACMPQCECVYIDVRGQLFRRLFPTPWVVIFLVSSRAWRRLLSCLGLPRCLKSAGVISTHHCLQLLCGLWELNSGLQDCAARISLTELSPQPGRKAILSRPLQDSFIMLVRFPHKQMESQCGTIWLGVLMLYYACVALLTGTSCNDGMLCIHDAQTDSHYHKWLPNT